MRFFLLIIVALTFGTIGAVLGNLVLFCSDERNPCPPDDAWNVSSLPPVARERAKHEFNQCGSQQDLFWCLSGDYQATVDSLHLINVYQPDSGSAVYLADFTARTGANLGWRCKLVFYPESCSVFIYRPCGPDSV